MFLNLSPINLFLVSKKKTQTKLKPTPSHLSLPQTPKTAAVCIFSVMIHFSPSPDLVTDIEY